MAATQLHPIKDKEKMTILSMKNVGAVLSAPDFDSSTRPIVRGGMIGEALPSNDDNGRIITYLFSTGGVARDGNTIAQNGWQLDNFQSNPVFLFAHDADAPPIGRVPEIGVKNGMLQGAVEYATAEIYPFADTIYRLVKGRFLNAVSVSWMPLTWRFATDKSRPGSIDFLTQELWEISQVPLPADPNALVTARSAGIDTGPIVEWAEKILDQGGALIMPRRQLEALRSAAIMPSSNPKRSVSPDWKVGAARELPVSQETTWDGPAAAERILDAAGFNGDAPDAEKAARGFLAYDSANPTVKSSFKLPFADIVDGELTAIKGGLDASAQRLSQTDIPQAARNEAQAVIDGYTAKLKDAAPARNVSAPLKRGLYTVSYLADVLGTLAYIQQTSQWEETQEQDDSKVPSMLLEGLKQLGSALVAMTLEEVNEMLAGCDIDPIEEGDVFVAAAKTPAARAIRALEMKMRSGRVLSKANEDALRAAHGQITDACAQILGVVDQTSDNSEEDDTEARAVRLRKAKALQRRAQFSLTEIAAE